LITLIYNLMAFAIGTTWSAIHGLAKAERQKTKYRAYQ
jgi:hypothetical protein